MDQNTSDQVPMPGGDSQGRDRGRTAMMKVLLFLVTIGVIVVVVLFAFRALKNSDSTGLQGVPTGPQIDF